MEREGKEANPREHIDNDVTAVNECSPQRSNLKDNGYIPSKGLNQRY